MANVVIDENVCDNCEDCINECGEEVFGMVGNKVAVVEDGACLGKSACSQPCVENCENTAITINKL